MLTCDEDHFNVHFANERTWTTVLSNGSAVSLKPNGAELPLSFADREEYIQLVKESRMNESKLQVLK